MSSQVPRQIPAWSSTPRLVLAAFAVQTSASLVVWFSINDRSSGRGVWMNSDFEEWATLTAICAALLIALSGLVLRRWLATSAVAAGCVLAGMLGLAIFVGWAVFNSA